MINKFRTLGPLLIALGVLLVVVGCGGRGSAAQTPEEFYRGKTITFLVMGSVGGGVDTYARMIQPFLEQALGATIVVKNEGGAGGIVGMNSVAAAEPDGLTIGTSFAVGQIGAQIAGIEGVRFDLSEFEWLAGITPDPNVLIVRADLEEIQTIDDLLASNKTYRFGTSGVGGAPYVDAIVFGMALGKEWEIITGYDGSVGTAAGMARGEIDFFSNTIASSLNYIRDGEQRPLLALSMEEHPDFPEVATIPEMRGKIPDEAVELLRIYAGIYVAARPIFTTPGVPAERVEFLRQAIRNALNDEVLLRQAAQANRPVNYISGEDIATAIRDLLDAPEQLREVIRQGYAAGG